MQGVPYRNAYRVHTRASVKKAYANTLKEGRGVLQGKRGEGVAVGSKVTLVRKTSGSKWGPLISAGSGVASAASAADGP